MGNISRNIYFKNIFWNFLNQFGKSGFQIIVTIVLARLLSPSDFGTIAMVTILTQFAEIMIEGGFLMGIVQLKDITQRELSAIFFLNLAIGIICSCIIFVAAPWIALLYNNSDLVIVARVLSVSCIFTASAVVQHGLMIREMNYKNRTIAQFFSQLISGIIAIGLAYRGLGVMSLVYYIVIQVILSSLFYWLQSSWRPILSFSIKDLRRIWAYSSNILGVTLLGNIAGRTDILITGIFFTPKMLGLYSKGKDFAMLPATVGSEIVSLSLFPIFARLEDDKFNSAVLRTLKILIFGSSIFFGLLSINAKEITLVLLGNGWLEAGDIFRLYFIVAFFYLINTFFTNVINATGKSRINLKKELVQAPLRILMLVVIYYIFKPTNPLPFIYFWIVYYVFSNLYSLYLISLVCKLDFLKISKIGSQYIITSIILGVLIVNFVNLNSDILNVVTRSACFVLFFGFGLLLVKDNIFLIIKEQMKLAKL